ncbi:MAG: tetratricopeptide repeat protein [Epsilonproteobacteria bacterium]|nr:tetratricopeptide repeat protein [Campylobacterota bacterium]
MIRKYRHLFVLCSVIFFSPGCGKKGNKGLARTYHKMAVAHLTDQTMSDSSLRQALAYVDQALTLVPDAWQSLALKATLLFKLSRHQQSMDCFVRALSCCTTLQQKADVRNNYACVLAQNGKQEQALELWHELACDQHYLTPEVALVNQGKVLVEQGKFSQAKRCFADAVMRAPDFLDARYYLALVASWLDDWLLANHELENILFVAPDHAGAQALKAYVEQCKNGLYKQA